MSDVNANINISIDSSQALGQLRALQSQISAFNQSVIAGNTAAAASQRSLTANLAAQIGATKAFTTSMVNVESSVSRLGTAIDKNKLSLGQYFRYGIAASGSFGKSMKEHAEIMELAGDRVKRLQTQYVAMGQAHNGMTRAMAIRPLQLHNADAAVGIQRQQIFNKLMHDGSTAMVNWGKNTQWAGRQLMVGFTVPLTIFGGVAGKIFMDLEKQVIQFKRVYGDLQTPSSEKNAMVEEVKALGKEFTKYGIAVNDTIGLAAKAAATGAQGADLMAITTESTRLATLGQIDYQQALDATISLQTAFRISSEDLAQTTDFLNAVENQTVTSLDDITQAIPLVAPVIKGLGGDVKDLAVFLTAMREGGVNANEGANALKSGLASMINPTKAAREQLALMKIDIDAISANNRGDIQGFVMEFGKALEGLSKFERQQTLAKVFGKYQFARMGALFSNISKEGSQAQRVIDLTGASVKELAALSEGELGQLEEAVGVKFTAAVEKLKLAIAPVGEAFLKIATPLINFATTLAEKFNSLPDGMKTFLTWGVAIGGVVIPAVVMLVGLFANFLGQMVKMGNAVRMLFSKTKGLGAALQYLSGEELDALAASASLEGQTNSLTGALNVQRNAVIGLANAYGTYAAAAGAAAANLPQGFRGPGRAPRRMATGGFVAGSGNKDSEPALLMPGEFVVNKKAAQANGPLLSAMNAGRLKGYAEGTPGTPIRMYGENMIMVQERAENQAQQRVSVPSVDDVLAPFAARAGEQRGIPITEATVAKGLFDPIAEELRPITTKFVEQVEKRFTETFAHIEDQSERMEAAWKQAGMDIQNDVEQLSRESDRTVAKKVMGLQEDDYGTIPTGESRPGSGVLDKARKGAFRKKAFGNVSSYTTSRRGIMSLWSKLTGQSSEGRDIGHVGKSKTGDLDEILADPRVGTGARQAKSTLDASALLASGEGAGTASPSKITEQQGKDVAKGLEIGIEQGTPAAVAAAEKMGAQTAAAADPTHTAAGRPWTPTPGGYLSGGASPFDPNSGPRGGANNQRNSPKTAGHAAMLAAGENATQRTLDEVGTEAKKTKKGFKDFGGKLMGGAFAMDGLLFGMSMMENSVGEFAQKIMPAAFAAQGLGMMLPMLTNPIGIAIAALGAAAAGLYYLGNQAQEMSKRSQEFADAMIASTDAMNGIAEAYGRESIIAKAASKVKKAEYGVTKKQDTESQKFIESELGQSMKRGLGTAISQLGASGAASQFASNLSSMVMQGVIGPKQAKALAISMGESLNNKTFGIKAAAELEAIIGPDGKDITKHPIKVALEIDKKNQSFIQQMGQNMQKQNIAGEMNSYAWNIEQDSAWGAVARGFRGLTDSEYRENTAQLEAAGAVIGNQMTQAYDNLTAAKERYKSISEEAESIDKKDADAKAEAAASAKRAERQLRMLTGSVEKQKMAYLGMYRDLGDGTDTSDAQGAMLRGMEQNILKQYESDPVMKAAWDAISGKTGALSGEMRFKIYTELESGGIDPMTMQNLIGIYGDNTTAATAAYLDLVYSVKGDSKLATSVVQGLMGNGVDSELMRKLVVDVQLMNDDAVRAYSDLLVSTSQIENEDLKKTLVVENANYDRTAKEIALVKEGLDLFLGLPDEIQKVVSVDIKNSDDFESVGRWYRKFKSEPDIEKDLIANDKFSAAFEAFGLNYDRFNALPNIKKALIMTYVDAFMTYKKEYDDANAMLADQETIDRIQDQGSVRGGGVALMRQQDTGFIGMQQTTEAVDNIVNSKTGGNTPVNKPGGNTDPEGDGGGGGGGGEKSWLENKMDELLALEKLYTTAGKNASKLVEKKGFFFGIMEKLRTGQRGKFGSKKMPSIPQFIIDSLGDGPEGLKNAMTLMKMSEGALKKFVALNKKVMVGQFVENKKKEANAIKQKGWVKKILEDSQVIFSEEEIDEILSDQTAIDAILSSAGKKRAEVLRSIRAAIDPAEGMDPEDAIGNIMDRVNRMFDNLEDSKRDEFAKKVYTTESLTVDQLKKQVDLKKDQIQAQQDIIDGKQEEIDDYQHLNDLDQQKIDDYNRQIELEQRKADALKREDDIRNRAADALSRELELMNRQEQTIRDAYQKRIEALDEVARLNERILQAQQDQLAISKALSAGDVYAAAEAAAAMQANQVKFASEQTKAGLEQGMENEVDGLTSNGMTKAQIEQQIQTIRDQSYQTSLQIRDIEDYIYELRQTKILPLEENIYNRNLLVRDLNNEIYNINESQIEPLNAQIEAYDKIISNHEKMLEEQIKELTLSGMTREEWERKSDAILDSIENAKSLTPELEAIKGKYDEIYAAAKAAADEAARIGGGVPNSPTGSSASAPSGNIVYGGMGLAFVAKNSGGRIRRYSTGSVVGDGARDSVSAMLTPGEFVVRKAMVEKYGESMFQQINQGSYSVPKYSAGGAVASAPVMTGNTSNNINAPVYNSYSVNVNASTNASADDIARTVIAKIKTIESSNIRRINGYQS